MLFQALDSRALRAALTARSMSALSPSATWQMVSPVAGLMAGNVLPETLSTHLPPMKSGWSLTLGALAPRVLPAVAVVMRSSCEKTGAGGVPGGARPAWCQAYAMRPLYTREVAAVNWLWARDAGTSPSPPAPL